ncbi:glycosyl transferase [Cohnella xylanilytica]|uniref:Glycosyltransferase n=1 Tax=Cohnella xylanilytica TaxID=557555 RepID=A0A841TWW8_9BACL|nr:glycosyltransferase family 2 protein [Cohnella xylanilytica]MBB6691522.1 glycosyltransferase [Cohnella xylanilytica]GIO12913.1 glycosyl transferase [Cohnella xylanilytica]
MSRLRLQINGIPIGKGNKRLQELKKHADDARARLERSRAEQSFVLLRLDNEAQELERQIEESHKRSRELENAPQDVLPVPSETTAPARSGRMGDRLVAEGLLTKAQLDTVIARQKQFGGRLGDIMIDLGFVTAEQLKPYLQPSSQKGRLGDLLVEMKYITSEQLGKALEFQKQSGGMLGDVLLSLQMLEPEQLYRAIATQNNIGRIGTELSLDTQVKLPEKIAREYGVVIVHQYSNRYLAAVNAPLSDERRSELERMLEMPIEQVLATHSEMEKFWAQVYGDEMMHESTSKLAIEQPHNSAQTTFTRAQIAVAALMLLFLIAGLLFDFWKTALFVNVLVQMFYFAMTVFKFWIVMLGSSKGAQYRFTPEELSAIDERELPVYTILVPMYKEAQVLPKLIRNLERLDYPKAKLDVRLLIEEDDIEMREVLRTMKLPAYYTVLVVPDSLPKTKPKACNYGLIRARGEYVVIYDAEDLPDPDQLKKVYATFKSCPEDYACIQAKLNYFNSTQNLLTRWFTQEYSIWFELLLPGIMRLDVPIPLGGTSNHFKLSVLKELNAWDPFNVTEDADLGIRLYKAGYKTAIVDSRTWEEANSRFGNWIRQRSRWIKGYMQTWLVHMRNPIRLWKEIGPKGFFGFQVMVLATPALPLLNPFFWLMIVLWYGWHMEFIPQFFPGPIYYMAAVEFLIGNFFFVYSNIAGVYWVIKDMEKKQENWIPYSLVKYALITPLYWVMMSIAAYKAAWQLIVKPFYWEKTTHGLDTTSHFDDAAPGLEG